MQYMTCKNHCLKENLITPFGLVNSFLKQPHFKKAQSEKGLENKSSPFQNHLHI